MKSLNANIKQTGAALILMFLGGLCFAGAGLAGLLENPQPINFGFLLSFVGGIPLTVFAVTGLLNRRLFWNLAKRQQ